MASEKSIEAPSSVDFAKSVDDQLVIKDDQGLEQAPASAPPVSAIAPPPNGGFEAWLQVAGAFFLFFNPW
jgi:hypothetical protein